MLTCMKKYCLGILEGSQETNVQRQMFTEEIRMLCSLYQIIKYYNRIFTHNIIYDFPDSAYLTSTTITLW